MTDEEIELNKAIETIKCFCTKKTEKDGNCIKCPFCSKGYNGCKLQTAPCEWELLK